MKPDLAGLWVENHGQAPDHVLYYTFGGPTPMWLTTDGVWWLVVGANPRPVSSANFPTSGSRLGVALFLSWESAAAAPQVVPHGPTRASASIYQGSDPKTWVEGASLWPGLRLAGLYANHDLIVTAGQDGPHFRLHSRPGSRHPQPEIVELQLQGGDVLLKRDPETGRENLVVATPLGSSPLPGVVTPGPVRISATAAGGAPIAIDLPGFAGQRGERGSVTSRQVTVQPLTYGSYLGGTLWDEAEAVAFHPDGDLILGGHTQSLDFPTRPGLQAILHNVDAFAARLDAGGGGSFITVLQGGDLQNGEEYITGLAVDALGSTYAVGRTDSLDFPTTPGAFDPGPNNGGLDGFAVRLAANGSLVYSTYLGGEDTDLATGVVIDDQGSAFITGGTWSSLFPTSPDAIFPAQNGQRDVFLAVLSPAGDQLVYGTYLGGTSQDQAEAIARHPGGSVYLTGWTRSDDFPTTGGSFDPDYNGGFDAFLVRLTPGAPAFDFATYLGGSGNDREDRAYGILALADGRSVLAGSTNSDDFPTTPGAFASNPGGGTCDFLPCQDAFLARLTSAGDQLEYATYLGGDGQDLGRALAQSQEGAIFLAGETESVNFPVTPGAFDNNLSGGRDAFLARFDPVTDNLSYATFLGGTGWDDGQGVAADGTQVTLAGKTQSDDMPVTGNAFATLRGGDYDAYAVILDFQPMLKVYLPFIQTSSP